MGERAGRFCTTFGAPYIDELEDGVGELRLVHLLVGAGILDPVVVGVA